MQRHVVRFVRITLIVTCNLLDIILKTTLHCSLSKGTHDFWDFFAEKSKSGTEIIIRGVAHPSGDIRPQSARKIRQVWGGMYLRMMVESRGHPSPVRLYVSYAYDHVEYIMFNARRVGIHRWRGQYYTHFAQVS